MSNKSSRHRTAVMIWLAVFPTLTVLQVLLGSLLQDVPMVLRTLVLATIAVPIVVYGLVPLMHRVRARLVTAGD
jgi:antibiotic biosynthesis monooxygenase (ABM) superfamily enzyme